MKEEVRLLIKDLQFACHQSLFNGIIGSTDDDTVAEPVTKNRTFHGSSEAKRRRIDGTTAYTSKSWDTILIDASNLLPSMTNHEHGQVSRLVSILFLGFLLPQSTGNIFFTLQNLSTQQISVPSKKRQQQQQQGFQSSGIQTSERNENQRMSDYIIYMSLEERLESSLHRYGNNFGELDNTIVHEHLENAFQSFLKSLKTFLSGRPAHTSEVDLIHILAMVIHPNPSEHCIRETSNRLEEEKSDIYEMTKRLMSNLVPHSFQVNYKHRMDLVQIVMNCLVLPECNEEAAYSHSTPLFEGALPHLRASLYAFGIASTSQYDKHLSQQAMVNLSIESGMVDVVKEEWNRLLHRLVDDRTNYTAAPDSAMKKYKNEDFCLHQSRGELLREFLIRYSESRQFADEIFLQHALSSLTDSIEFLVDCWTEKEIDEGEEKGESCKKNKVNSHTTDLPPRVLASLLKAAKELFHFLLPIKKDQKYNQDSDEEIEESEDGQYRDMLISCGIQLIHHWDSAIVNEACSMLVLAFSYTEEMWDDYVEAVFDSVVIAIDIAIKRSGDSSISVISIEGLVSAFSQRSLTFAVNIFQLLSRKENIEKNPPVVFRLVAAITNARPAVAQKYIGTLIESIKQINNPDVNKHIVASILSCRKTHYFANEQDSLTNLMPIIYISSLSNWDRYLISRHAMLTGNFAVAKELYSELMNAALSETSFIWLSALEKIAEGEARLCNDASKALPDSSSNLRTAISLFRSLLVLKQTSDKGFSTSFQVKLLHLRVSFLDLMTSIRQLTMEMRLLGVGPKRFTRPHLHLKNIIKLLDRMNAEYMKLYKQQGLFICQQSRTVLRTLRTLCSFVARVARRVFSDYIVVGEENQNLFSCGDTSHPLTLFMKQLDSFAVSKMNQSIDPKIRAVVLLQIIDGVLKTPIPTPRCLTYPKALPCASLRLVCDPEVHDHSLREDVPLEIDRGASIVILASGTIPRSMLSCIQIPFSVVLLWYTILPEEGSTSLPVSQKKGGIEGGADNKHQSNTGPIAASMSSNGNFFMKIESQLLMKEGSYALNFVFGCRDIRGGEWEIPLQSKHNPTNFPVKVVRIGTK
mmetsp:Transcript_54051/g.60432  ORF Transcript_54051/g.60432 Transcript_54051/m.60432 type:complete len:1088 (-) Transcript_54051:1412-4675(-)